MIPVAVIDGNFEKLDATVAEQKGNVVLVDFWATWCVPCVKKFPHLVEAHKKYRDRGLACMSASLDPKPKGDYDKGAVLKFLQEKGATFPNVVLIGYREETEKLGRRFGYEGGLPLLVLFDKTGKKVWDSEMWSDEGVAEGEVLRGAGRGAHRGRTRREAAEVSMASWPVPTCGNRPLAFGSGFAFSCRCRGPPGSMSRRRRRCEFALLPRVVMAAMHTTTIRASITAYSTAVGPSSRLQGTTPAFA